MKDKKLTPKEKAEKAYKSQLAMSEANRRLRELGILEEIELPKTIKRVDKAIRK